MRSKQRDDIQGDLKVVTNWRKTTKYLSFYTTREGQLWSSNKIINRKYNTESSLMIMHDWDGTLPVDNSEWFWDGTDSEMSPWYSMSVLTMSVQAPWSFQGHITSVIYMNDVTSPIYSTCYFINWTLPKFWSMRHLMCQQMLILFIALVSFIDWTPPKFWSMRLLMHQQMPISQHGPIWPSGKK